MYSIRLNSLAADRVAGHANNWTSRGKQTYSSYLGDYFIHQRKHPRTTYQIGGNDLCRNTFQFLMG